MRKHRALWALVLVASCFLAPSSTASERPNPAPFIASRATEVQAVTDGRYSAWVKDKGKKGWQLYVRGPGGRVVHANRRGTNGGLGAISGNRLVFREYRKKRSTIRLRNLRTGRTVDAPRAVNGRGSHEFFPVMGGKWLVFGRYHFDRYGVRVVAYNFNTKRTRTLYISDPYSPIPYIQPGQVTDRFFVMVVWARGSQSRFHVYDLKKGRSHVLFAPAGDDLWAPSVRADGTVYGVATGSRCGSRARLVRYPRQETGYYDLDPLVLTRLGAGFDSWNSHAYTATDGTSNVLYQRSRCDARRRSDIWSYRDMVELSVVKEGLGVGTVTSDPGRIDCGEVCTTSLAGSSTITLTATPAVGSVFAGWSGGPCDSSDNEVCVMRVDRDTQVTATFEPGL